MKNSHRGFGGGVLLAAGLLLLASCNRGAVDPFPGVAFSIESVDAEGRVIVDRAPEYDFGAVFAGQRVSRTMRVHNEGRVPLALEALSVSGGDAALVTFEPDEDVGVFRIAFNPASEVVIAPGAVREIELIYAPAELPAETSSLDHQLQLTLTVRGPGPEAATAEITLKGRTVKEGLRWRVDNLDRCTERNDLGVCLDPYFDFGIVRPNTGPVTREVTFENSGPESVELTELRFNANQGTFTIQVEEGADPTRLTIPGRAEGTQEPGVATLTVAGEPVLPGPAGSMLIARVDGTSKKLGIQARVVGAYGPHLDTVPGRSLDFGPVAHFPESPEPVFQERRLVLRNIGASNAGDAADNLHLGTLQTDGTRAAPYFEVVAGEGTAEGEFSARLEGSLPEEGLSTRAGERSALALVRFTPASVGTKRAVLRIFSNDPTAPVYELSLAAEAVVLPPCQGSLEPMSIDFGSVTPGTFSDGMITFTNLGTSEDEVCLVSDIRFSAETAPIFRLPEYPAGLPNVSRVPAGGTLKVVLRVGGEASNGGPERVTGALELSISSPTEPILRGTLAATLP